MEGLTVGIKTPRCGIESVKSIEQQSIPRSSIFDDHLYIGNLIKIKRNNKKILIQSNFGRFTVNK
jgi:hypothetical protein